VRAYRNYLYVCSKDEYKSYEGARIMCDIINDRLLIYTVGDLSLVKKTIPKCN